MEEKVEFISDGAILEGRLQQSSPDKAAIITHPHPLYGGHMDNTVVSVLAKACNEQGWASLRFDFRGTGGSQGRFDNGFGEQEDVTAAINYLMGRGFKRIALAGYSFGAWVIARWSQRPAKHQLGVVSHVVLVAPPVAFLEYKDIGHMECLRRVITGSKDEIAPSPRIAALLPVWNSEADLKILTGADHFFFGYLSLLATMAAEVIT